MLNFIYMDVQNRDRRATTVRANPSTLFLSYLHRNQRRPRPLNPRKLKVNSDKVKKKHKTQCAQVVEKLEVTTDHGMSVHTYRNQHQSSSRIQSRTMGIGHHHHQKFANPCICQKNLQKAGRPNPPHRFLETKSKLGSIRW